MPALKIRTLSIRRVISNNMKSDDRVLFYYLFLTLIIGIAAGFSFAYILFVYTRIPRAFPLQIFSFRRPLREYDSNIRYDYQEANRRIGEELVKKIKVFCWVMTQPKNHEAKAKHVKATWGKRCTKLLFISSVEDKNLPALSPKEVTEGKPFIWGKTRAAFRYLYDYHRDDADWFLKADDDTYVIVDNLRYMLADYDSRDPIYFGCRFKNFTPQGYMSGGAGYVLSREALHRFVVQAMPDPTLCRSFDIGPEDIEMGKCLYNVGVRAMDSRDHQKRGRFFPFRPQDHLFNRMNKSFWFWEYVLYPTSTNSNCCSDYAVSFHAIDPWMMYVFEYFLYHLRPYGFHHHGGPLPQLLKRQELDSSEIV